MKYIANKKHIKFSRINSIDRPEPLKALLSLIKPLLLVVVALSLVACPGSKKTAKAIPSEPKISLPIDAIDKTKAYFATSDGKPKSATNDGLSWEQALDLQSAIDAAFADANKDTVLVAQGSYFADPDKTNQEKFFELKSGVKIYAGFEKNTDLNKRTSNVSILEGKLSNSLNSKLLLKGENLANTTVVDGFLIQNALNADAGTSTDKPENYIKGGALLLVNSSPKLVNLTFKNNRLTGAKSYGAAVFNLNDSKPLISYSTFKNNYAEQGGAICNFNNSDIKISDSNFSSNYAKLYGGAIYSIKSALEISNSKFNSNKADDGAGAIYSSGKSATIKTSNFSANSAQYNGGAIFISKSNLTIDKSIFKNNLANKANGGSLYNDSSTAKISDSIFLGNFAFYDGGAISNHRDANMSFSNCAFSVNNASNRGGAIYNGNKFSPKIYNSILWNNKDKHTGSTAINNIYSDDKSIKPEIKHSILNENSVVTKTAGTSVENYDFITSSTVIANNSLGDPLFNNDMTLKATSPAKNTGDNNLYKEITGIEAKDAKDLAGKARLLGEKIDIGAYELEE